MVLRLRTTSKLRSSVWLELPQTFRLFLFPLAEIGVRGDLVLVKKSVGRNKLLSQGLAVYASPENKKLFEEEKLVSSKDLEE